MSHVTIKTNTVATKAVATPSHNPEPPVLSTEQWNYVHRRLSNKIPKRYELTTVFAELDLSTDKYTIALRIWEEKEKVRHVKYRTYGSDPAIPVPDVIQWDKSSLVQALHKNDIAKAHKLISATEWHYELGYSPVYYSRSGKYARGGWRNHVITRLVLRKNIDVFVHLLNKMAKLMREKKIPVADHLGLMKIPFAHFSNARVVKAYTRYFTIVMGITA